MCVSLCSIPDVAALLRSHVETPTEQPESGEGVFAFAQGVFVLSSAVQTENT